MIGITGSTRPPRRFWGWGALADRLTSEEIARIHALVAGLGGPATGAAEPREEDYALVAPRVPAPSTLAGILSSSSYDRLVHSYGKSYADCARMWMRQVPNAPDWVAFPRVEADVRAVLDWAGGHDIAVVPFGGGTSVVGGVEPSAGEGYAGSVSLDMERFDRVLEIDRASRSARIQAGVLGPDLEAALRPHGLTLRHFPQSFQFSTVGGWVATRSGGHYATQYTHIDEFVQSIRMIAPAGEVQTRRLPGSGAGPAPDRLLIGSEGTFGVITEAWLRLQERPRFRAAASVRFGDMSAAAGCVRALSQSGLQPSNCRLLDANEVAFAGVGDGRSPTLVLGFESADHDLRPWMTRAIELVADHGGRWDAESVDRSMRGAGEHRTGAAGAWRDAFLRMPYLRDEAIRFGIVLDTFESAVTWDRFEAFYHGVLADVGDAIKHVTGRPAPVSCRFTHVYPDGPAPYFNFAARGGAGGDLAGSLAMWREIKLACTAAVVRHGGTCTHHHAVGRDHRSGYEVEVPELVRQALAGAKAVFDPQGVMNPGVLIDPRGRDVGITGATG